MAAGLALSAPAVAGSKKDAVRNQPAPATQPAPAAQPVLAAAATKTPIIVTHVEGTVSILRPEKAQVDNPHAGWEPARVGMVLTEGAKVRVSPLRSGMVLTIGSTQTITIDRGSMTVRQALNDAGVERTRIDVMEMGRLQIDVDSSRIPNDVQVTAPDMVLAVKGTTFIIEVMPGFPTFFVGAEKNTGAIRVTNAAGATATLTGQQQGTATNPDPAATEAQLAYVETSKTPISADERSAAERAPGNSVPVAQELGFSLSGFHVIANPITQQPPAALSRFFSVSPPDGKVEQVDLNGNKTTVREGLSFVPGPLFTGAAIVAGTIFGDRMYVSRSGLIPDGAGAVAAATALFSLDLDNPAATFVEETTFGSEGSRTVLTGLGSIGARLFGAGFEVGDETIDHVYELFPQADTLKRAMTLPGFEIGGVGGSTERGSLFLGGRLALADGSNQFAVLEVDPRTNYMINAFGGTDAEFTPGAGTFVAPGVDPSSIDNVTGLAYVDGVVVMSATALVGGVQKSVLIQYDPTASNSAADPRLRRIDLADASLIDALASERGGLPSRARPLANPPGPIDTTSINPMFAQMAYSEAALRNDVLSRMVASEIISSAEDPSRCAASGALDALPAILRNHVDKVAGVGRTVAEFRGSLPIDHPCRKR
jgi:hypothetical protein